MSDNTFQQIGESDDCLHGPMRILVCGYSVPEQELLLTTLEQSFFRGLAVVFASDDHADQTVEHFFSQPDRFGSGRASAALPRAIIIGGIPEKAVQPLMGVIRQIGFSAHLWATLTPISETWTLEALLKELQAEHDSFQRNQT